MSDELVARLRTALARVAVEALIEPTSTRVPAAFPPPFSTMTVADWRRAIELWKEHSSDLLASASARPCPACGSSRSRWMFDSYDAHAYHECASCGCWFIPKVVDWALFERLFERCPEARAHAAAMMAHRDDAALREIDMLRIGGYLDELLPLLPSGHGKPVSYLDAGCGVGHSLRAAAARGVIAQGVEVDDAAVAIARANGLPVAYASEMDTVPGPYDLVSFWETLEHIASPFETLRQFASRLADDGLVAITVPNRNAPSIRAMREASAFVHGGYNTPGHVNLFHPNALELLLARAGLTMIDVDGQYGGNPVELAAFFLGETGGAFDFLQDAHEQSIPKSLADALTAMLPAFAVFERMALLSPILVVLACRQGYEHLFQRTIDERKARRRQQLETEARTIVAADEAVERHLQDEINRRDELLRVEIGKRDQLLRDLEHHLQSEIQQRDRLLADADARWNSRLTVRVRQRIRRLLAMS